LLFCFGAFFSALAGNMGMKIATKTNVKQRTSLPQALKVSFGGGTVMGLELPLAVLGLTGFLFSFFIFL
jgi:K(+)-stimulated pyrophosphate-energized sodium pump